MRPQKTTTLLLTSFLWLLLVKELRTIDGQRIPGYASSGLWYTDKSRCEYQANRTGGLCVKSNPTR